MLDMSNYIIFFINIHDTHLIPVVINVYLKKKSEKKL